MALDIEAFARKRAGWPAVVILALWIVGWVGATLLFRFDTTQTGERFTLLNFLLSVEATLSTPLLYMAIERAAQRDRAKIDELLQETRNLVAAASGIEDDIEDIGASLDEIEQNILEGE